VVAATKTRAIMAEVLPFRAVHYNPNMISGLNTVLTQPYDKVSPEMQARYYDLAPHNLVRIIRGRHLPNDGPHENVYSRAARYFREWMEDRILVSAAEPALYPYYQEYTVPGRAGATLERRGFIALLRLQDYSARVVHRHEETLSGPKADRLELLKSTRAHFGQIFMLYGDPEGSIEATLEAHGRGPVWQQVEDEYGTLHSVWRVTDPVTIEQVAEAMIDKKLVIADGHHRYETALAYRDLCRTQSASDERAEQVMVTLVRLETPGLTILPTHRVVHSLSGFDWQQFAAGARALFDWEDVPSRACDWRRFVEYLAEAGFERPALGVYARPARLALLRLRKNADLASLLPDLPPSLRRLDVVILHRLLLEGVLGISQQAVREERNLRYVRELEAATAEVDQNKAQICFLMNPTPIAAVRENAFAGIPMPQKSTDFYPKLLSGLTIYWLDNPAGL
jgi:uncharacterized protein (DUF1015 family)